MYNKETIDKIQEKTKEFLNDAKEKDFRCDFNFENINVKEKQLHLNDYQFNEEAKNKLLGLFRVKSDFDNHAKYLSEDEWADVINKIKKTEKNKQYIAQINAENQVINIYATKEDKKNDDLMDTQFIVDKICENLGQCTNEFELKSYNLIKDTEKFNLVLLNRENTYDIFGDGSDKWDVGNSFIFNPFYFQFAPFFERLSCANGMRSPELGKANTISNKKFHVKSVENLIEKVFENDLKYHEEMIKMTAQHLRDNNASIGEFMEIKRFLSPKDDNETHKEQLIKNYFDEEPFYKTYGENIEKKSPKWKSTANSGINAYDFFNLLTWIASHPEETKLKKDEIIELQIKAANFFFKKELDLEDIAQYKEVDYPIIAEV